jgi:glucose-6-phosphate isomerase
MAHSLNDVPVTLILDKNIDMMEKTTRDIPLRDSPTWQELIQHQKESAATHLRDLFAADRTRADRFSIQLNDIYLDYSKNLVTDQTMKLLFNLARESGLGRWREALFNGDRINHTEGRPVLHMALRNRITTPLIIDGEDIRPRILHELERVRAISEAVRGRVWRGVTGQPIRDVVNIGIGGSDLGPKMVTDALRPYAIHDLRIHFLSNLDENHVSDILEELKPETTLFIISSKSFATQDTLLNADTACEWFHRSIPELRAREHHFIAVTANPNAALHYGIPQNNILHIWDWVGGRYSLWSAIGLPIAISIGMDNFEAMLQGAEEMDRHFRETPFEENMPVILALLGVWYNNFYGAQTHAILPYDEHMHFFPAYLQQADMESNGKSIDRTGTAVDYTTGPVIFGEIGIKGQHAFYQLLHQGTKLVPADILAPIKDFHCIKNHHRALMSNVFAQAEALMMGRSREEAREEMQGEGRSYEEIERLLPYKSFPGNKPTNTLLFRTLDPKTLGTLIALYEHKIFVQGVIWNINSFDQWGVELGKKLAVEIRHQLDDDKPVSSHDPSTNNLINYYKRVREEGI